MRRNLIDLLGNERFERYQRQHGDATALDRKLTSAISRAAEGTAAEVPALMALLVLLRKSYAAKARDAALVFQRAAEGRIDAATDLLALFEADRHWDTLARLLIAWVAPPDKARRSTHPGRGRGQVLRYALSGEPSDVAAAALRRRSTRPPRDLRRALLRYVSAILQRAGGAEGVWAEGLEPLNSPDPVSGTDAGGVHRGARCAESGGVREARSCDQHGVPRTLHRHPCGEPVRLLP